MNPTLHPALNKTRRIASASLRQPTPVLQSNSIQNLGFAVLLPYLFFVFSRMSEFVDTTGRAHLVMILALAAGFAVLTTGGIFRAIGSRPGIWITAFTMWLILALPFSSWRGGSFAAMTDIWLRSYVTFLLTAGLIVTYSQCRQATFTLAMASAGIVIMALKGGIENADDSRLALSYGTLGNSNDLAGQLMMGLPFCIYVAFDKARNIVVRLFFLVMSALLVIVVFKTGSRGGLLTIICTAAMFFWSLSVSNKVRFGVVLLCILSLTPALLPRDVRDRYFTLISGRKPNVQVTMNVLSALESQEARRVLLWYSLEFTIKHPVFGVGLQQFPYAAWDLSVSRKQQGIFHPVHDIFALIASETGIPALIFYTTALVVCFKMLNGIRRATRSRPSLDHISKLAYCLLMSLTSFTLCGVFNTNAYSLHFPLIAGLIAAFAYSARQQIAAHELEPADHAARTRIAVGISQWGQAPIKRPRRD